MRYKRIQNCLFLSGLSVFAQLYLFQPLLTPLCTAFSLTPAESSLAVSFATAGMAAGLFVLAFRADTLPCERLMSIALIGSAVLTLLTAFAWNFPSLPAMALLEGFLLSGVSAVAPACLDEELGPAIIGVSISLYLSRNTI